MQGFKNYFEASESLSDLEKTLRKLPKTHRELVRGYKWKFTGGNTLDGDRDHVGLLDTGEKSITVAAPWNYGREMAILHEIAHIVWEVFVKDDQKDAWKSLVARTQLKKGARQSPEELFCMAYGSTYAKHPPTTYYHPQWADFIKSLS